MFRFDLLAASVIIWAACIYGDPRIEQPLGKLSTPFCSIFSYIIPLDAYVDSFGNPTVKMTLLNGRGESITYPPWIYLNETSRTLYILPNDEPGPHSYKIRVSEGNGGVSVDDDFTVEFTGSLPPSTVMEFMLDIRTNRLPATVEMVYYVIEKLQIHFGNNSNQDTIHVLDTVLVRNFAARIYYQNCTYRTDKCPSSDIFEARLLLYDNPSSQLNKVNTNLQAALLPYTLNEVVLRSRGECALPNAPFPNLFDWPDPGYTGQWYLQACGGVQRLQVPQELVLDEEDGDTRSLRVKLLNGSQEVLSTSWINVNTDTLTQLKSLAVIPLQSVWAIPRLGQKFNPTRNVLRYRLIFYDFDNLSTQYEFYPVFTGSYVDNPPNDFYSVECRFTATSAVSSMKYIDQVELFLDGLYTAFGSEYQNLLFVRTYNVLFSQEGSSSSGSTIWSLCGLSSPCNFTRINYIRSKMLSESNPTSEFLAAFNNDFEITSIQEHLHGPCDINRPEIIGTPLKVDVTFCGPFHFQIPENTFFDKEDGNSRNLNITMLNTDRTPIPYYSWIQFNASSQTIYGTVPSDKYSTTMQREIFFPLIVTDSSMLNIESSVRVVFQGAPKSPKFQVSLTGTYASSSLVDPTGASYSLLQKLGHLFGDGGKSFQLLSHYHSDDDKELIRFSNCSWREDPCDSKNIEQYKSKLLNEGGGFRQSFYDLLLPEFPNPNLVSLEEPPCPGDPPLLDNLWGPLEVSTCQTMSREVPENTFSDAEDGSTRHLLLSIAPTDLAANPWIKFDSPSQTLTTCAASAFTSTNIALIATDNSRRTAQQTLVLNIEKSSTEVSHSATMEMAYVSNDFTHFVDIYNQFRDRLKAYFTDSVSSNTVGYLQLSSVTSRVLQVEWTNCSIPTDKCDLEKVNYVRGRLVINDALPHPLLVIAMQGVFDIRTVSFNMKGVCKDELTPPKVVNPINTIEITLCTRIAFQIPENTFEDVIDGKTRNLHLALVHESGEQISSTYWLSFNKDSQTIHAAIDATNQFTSSSATYKFNLTAHTKRGLSAWTLVTIQFTRKQIEPSYSFQLTLRWQQQILLSNAEVWTTIFKRFATVFGLPDSRFYFMSGSVNQNYFVPQCASCSQGENECDQAFLSQIRNVSKSNNFYGLFAPDFAASAFQEFLTAQCEDKTPPEQVRRLPSFMVSKCSSFRQNFDRESFRDRKDLHNLQYLIVNINGDFVNELTSWIRIDSAQYQFYGVPSNEQVNTQPSSGYNVTFRVIDSDQQYIESWTVVQIIGGTNTISHQFKALVTIDSQENINDLLHQMALSDIVNSYFGQDVVNIISYKRLAQRSIEMIWSVCTLPNDCSNDGRQNILNIQGSMITGSGGVQESFQNAFKGRYKVDSIEKLDTVDCNSANPTARQDPYILEVTYCGGFEERIPEDLFSDQEDGNTRNLTLRLQTKDELDVTSVHPWLFFNINQQKVSGTPTRNQAIQMNNEKTEFLLTAIDKDAQEVSITMQIQFRLPDEPKFLFSFDVSAIDITRVETALNLMTAISGYRNESNSNSIGLISLSSTNMQYGNCSVSYDPCDWATLQDIKSSFTVSNGIPNAAFKSFLEPEYTVTFVSTSYTNPCPGTNPPQIVNPIPNQIIFVCGIHNYIIPENTFSDTEQGNAANLDLSLTTPSSAQDTWVHFDKVTRTIVTIPIVSYHDAMPNGGYSFAVVAMDNTRLSTKSEYRVSFRGPIGLLKECQIQSTFDVSSSMQASSSFVLIREFIQMAISYFQLESNAEIGIVDFRRASASSFTIWWSYCSKHYHSETYDLINGQVDYYGFVTKILMRVFNDDRVGIRPQFASAFSTSFTLSSLQTLFSGRCRNFPPIVTPGNERIDITLYYGGCETHTFPRNIFYDFEDGLVDGLDVLLSDAKNLSVPIDSWININIGSLSVYSLMYDDIRFSSVNQFQFFIHAEDSEKLHAAVAVYVTRSMNVLPFAPFNVTYEMRYTGALSFPYAIQSCSIVHQIVTYFNVSTRRNVLIRWFIRSNGFPSGRQIFWSVASETCSSSILVQSRSISSSDGVIDENFRSTFSTISFLSITRYYYTTSCIDPSPPITVDPIPPQNISFCSLYSYKIPLNAFYDTSSGVQANMHLELLNNNGILINSSFWLQLNTATLQIYGINIVEVYRKMSNYMFRIRATNRGRKSIEQLFSVSLQNTPYTVDCPVTVVFKYNFISTYIADIDVLWAFAQHVSNFYEDNSVMIKILGYSREADTFTLRWSNCSFSFSSEEQAIKGLQESSRTQLESIFNRMVSSTGTIQSAFRSHMSTAFSLQSVEVSYACIEKPPRVSRPIPLSYAYACYRYEFVIPKETFMDDNDGDAHQLTLSLYYANNHQQVSINEWVQIDQAHKMIYGVVTEAVMASEPPEGYRYLIRATDRAGMTVNTSYIIKIADEARSFDVFFLTGFTYTISGDEPTARTLYDTVTRLGNYVIPGDERIYVKRYRYPSTLMWQHCTFLTECTSSRVEEIYKRLQINRRPADTFIEAMKPGIAPYYSQIVYQNERCIPPGKVIVIVNPPPPTSTRTTCGYFSYVIPQYLFTDLSNRDTRDFVLFMTDQNGESVTATSWYLFNQTTQTVHGVAALSRASQRLTFKIRAQHSQGTASAESLVNITFTDFDRIATVTSTLCWIRTVLEVSYNPAISDVTIIKYFMEAISALLASSSSEIQVFSYTRSGSHPYHFEIIWTNCTLTSFFLQNPYSQQYYTSVLSLAGMLGTRVDLTYTVFDSVNLFLQTVSKFTIKSMSLFGTCAQPPDPGPVPKQIPVIDVPFCGEFSYEIPEDAFTDGNTGITRQLSLQLLNTDQSSLSENHWLMLNESQFIIGLPDKNIFSNQPTDGYKFILRAVDDNGKQADQVITVLLQGSVYPIDKIITNITVELPLGSESDLSLKLALLRKFQSHPILVNQNRKFYYHQFTVTTDTEKRSITAQLIDCETCQDGSIAVMNFKNENPFFLIQFFQPQFLVKSLAPYVVSTSEVCTDDLKENSPPRTLVLSYCEIGTLDLIADFRSIADQFEVRLLTEAGFALSGDSWAFHNPKTDVFEFYPPESYWVSPENQVTNYSYWVIEKASGVAVQKTKLVVKLDLTTVISDALDYKMTLTSTGIQNQVDGFYISEVVRALETLLGGQGLHFSEFKKTSSSPFSFEVTWKNCSLPNCDFTATAAVTDILFATEQLSNKYTIQTLLIPELQITSLENKCADQTPRIKTSIVVTVPICGLFRYRLPTDFAVDQDGNGISTMTVSMTNSDGSTLPIDSWIRIDNALKEIYAMPTEAVVKAYAPDGRQYLLLVTDMKGRIANTTITTFIAKDTPSYFIVNAVFESKLEPNSFYLDIQILFLNLVSKYTSEDESLEAYRVLSFSRRNNDVVLSFMLSYAMCSIPNKLCANKQNSITQIETALQEAGSTSFSSSFSNFIRTSFVGSTIAFEKRFIVDRAPRVTGVMSSVELSDCGARNVCIPANLFTDEDGTTFNMNLAFLNSDGTTLTSSSWIQYYDRCIYIVPYGEIKPGSYNHLIRVTDSCDQYSEIIFSVQLSDSSITTFGYQVHVDVVTTITIENENIYRYALWERFNTFLGHAGDSTKILHYERENSEIAVAYGDCSIVYQPCNRSAVMAISSRILPSSGSISSTLINTFTPLFIINGITEKFDPLCNKPLPIPCCRQLNVTARLCEKLLFKIPSDSFSTTLTGNTVLKYEMLTTSMSPLSPSSWVQFNASTMTLYGYPRVHPNQAFTRNYVFRLVATDINGNSASLPVHLNVFGDVIDVTYQMTIDGTLRGDLSPPNAKYECNIIPRIESFFQLGSINNIGLSRTTDSSAAAEFSWSFCSMRSEPCDCNMVQSIQEKLANEAEFREHLRHEIDVNRITFQRYGSCTRTSGPELRREIDHIDISSGKPFAIPLPADQFVDIEDGTNVNLTLVLRNRTGYFVDYNWIRVQDNKVCGIYSWMDIDNMGYVENEEIPFQIQAIDRCGQMSVDTFVVRITSIYTEVYYKIYLLLEIPYQDFVADCDNIENFKAAIVNYTNIDPESFIVHSLTSAPNASMNGTYISFSCVELSDQSCDNDMYDKCYSVFYDKDASTVDPQFLDYMSSRFPVVSVSPKVDRTDCDECTIIGLRCWIFALLLVLILLLLALLIAWCCWLCVPLCCAGWCGKYCPCCRSCCAKGGACATAGGKDDSKYVKKHKKNKNAVEDDKVEIKDGGGGGTEADEKWYKGKQEKIQASPLPSPTIHGIEQFKPPPPYKDDGEDDEDGFEWDVHHSKESFSPPPSIFAPPAYTSHKKWKEENILDEYFQTTDEDRRHLRTEYWKDEREERGQEKVEQDRFDISLNHGFGNQQDAYEQARKIERISVTENGQNTIDESNLNDRTAMNLRTESWTDKREADRVVRTTERRLVERDEYDAALADIDDSFYDDVTRDQRATRQDVKWQAYRSNIRNANFDNDVRMQGSYELKEVRVKKPVAIKVPRELAKSYLKRSRKGGINELPINLADVKALLKKGHNRLKIDRKGRVLEEDSTELSWDSTHDFKTSQKLKASTRTADALVDERVRYFGERRAMSRSMDSLPEYGIDNEAYERSLTISPDNVVIRMTHDDIEDGLTKESHHQRFRQKKIGRIYRSKGDLVNADVLSGISVDPRSSIQNVSRKRGHRRVFKSYKSSHRNRDSYA